MRGEHGHSRRLRTLRKYSEHGPHTFLPPAGLNTAWKGKLLPTGASPLRGLTQSGVNPALQLAAAHSGYKQGVDVSFIIHLFLFIVVVFWKIGWLTF